MAIDERRIVNALEANIVEADTIQGSEVSEQRQRNHIFYAMDRLGNEQPDLSQHISGDVLDAVESQKSYYLEAFYSGRKVVQFQPENDKDQQAYLATEYVNIQFNDKNDGYEFTRDSLHDAMVAKRCVAQVSWSEEYETITEQFQPMPMPQYQMFQAQLQQVDGEILDVQQVPGPSGLMATGTVRYEKDVSQVAVELVQPERYYRDPDVAYVKEAAFAGYQEDVTRYELVDRGFDEDEVNKLSLDYRFRQNEEDAARKAHDSTWSRNRRHKRPNEQEVVTVYHSWTWMDMSNFSKGDGNDIEGTRLYKFVWSQGELLTLPETMEDEGGEKWVEAPDGMPFIEWTQYKISHSEYGLCEADINSDIQWSKSNLYRLIENNQAMVNSSRWVARDGAIKNPRELYENTIGGVIYANQDVGDVVPLATPPLSAASFQTLAYLDTEKENRSGMSRLAKGLNADAVSNQNADDMIERLTNSSNRRVMRGVRDYAQAFLVPLFLRIYDLGVKYDKGTHHAEVSGEWPTLQPSEWIPRSKCYVSVALTPEQGEEKARFLLGLNQLLVADPSMGLLYGVEQKHALLDDVCDLMGVGDTSRYMAQPDSPEVQQKIQAMQQDQQQQQQVQQVMLMMSEKLKNNEDERRWMETRLKALETQSKVADTAADNLRDDEQFAWQRQKDQAEIDLEREQQRGVAL